MKKTFTTTIVRDGSMCFIPVPFDPHPVFGKVRAPVKVTLNGYTYRSTIASMGNGPCIPLRRSNREAAGLGGNETLNVTLELDADKREVKPPADFVRALKAKGPAWDRWRELSYSHQREHVEAIEQAKKPETRARRIEGAVEAIAARPPRSKAQGQASTWRKLAGRWESDVAPERESASLLNARTRGRSVDLDSKPARARRRLNAAWHERHPMPKNPTTEQRLAWHQAHEKNCGCRPMPAKLRAFLR